jgi:hypothetical protein
MVLHVFTLGYMSAAGVNPACAKVGAPKTQKEKENRDSCN